jgi:hypothetical protein
MLNVAIGVGRGGGVPRVSGSYADTAPTDPEPPPGLAAKAGLSISSATPRRIALRRRSAGSPFPDAAPAAASRLLPLLRVPALFESECALPRTRRPCLVARALFFLLVTFMATWDKTLLFTPLVCQLQLFFLEYLRLLVCSYLDAKLTASSCSLRTALGHRTPQVPA